MPKTALITGASGGIGLDFARKFAENGYHLVLVARRQDNLAQLAAELQQQHGVSALALPKDLADPRAPQAIFDRLTADGVHIDVLVNNAGFGAHGPFHEIDLQRQLDMIQVNLTALTHLTRLFLPGMVARRYGRILNMGSTGSFAPSPLMAVYSATKAYVLSFSDALANELRGTGVSVTTLCPGPTASGFQQASGVENVKLVQGRLMDSRAVVDQAYRALLAGKPLVIPGFQNRLVPLAARLLPRRMMAASARRALERVEH
jgi:short-subunit dehydrogenase